MNILIIDGQGGKLGAQLVKNVTEQFPDDFVTAVGTNSAATSAMVKSGAGQAATGDNPVRVAAKKADIIIGPIGIVIADSLGGEITPAAALAVARSSAVKILIPSERCGNLVAGISSPTLTELIADAMIKLKKLHK